MHWLDGNLGTLRLDIIGFLAILGEGSVTANAQVALLSKFAILPRLMPAPQALLRTTRPDTLKPHQGQVLGPHSGNYRPVVNHIAELIHTQEKLAAYSVRYESIERCGQSEGPHVKPKDTGPTTLLFFLGTAMTIALLVLSIVRRDGFALLATILLSLLSSLIGLGNKSDLSLGRRTSTFDVPKDVVIIKYPNGAFRIVKCTENVARQLYYQPEICTYLFSDREYRLISLIGTIMLMFGVISLGNCTIELQLAFGAAYMLLNVAYWAVAALPATRHWDLSAYETKKVKFVQKAEEKKGIFEREAEESKVKFVQKVGASKGAFECEAKESKVKFVQSVRASKGAFEREVKESKVKSVDETEESRTFTEALWKAIAASGSATWAHRSQTIAPNTAAWSEWLSQAQEILDKNKAQQESDTVKNGNSIQDPATNVRPPKSVYRYIKWLDCREQKNPDPEKATRGDANSLPSILIPDWNFNESLAVCLNSARNEAADRERKLKERSAVRRRASSQPIR